MAGTIITFYSYKGGAGRSMCVANTAWILASNGLRVLAVDWDLEAPGLHRYFHPFLPDHELLTSNGVIDLIWEFAEAVLNTEGSGEPGWHKKFARISPYAMSIQYSFPGVGTIDFVPAGRQDSSYSALVSSFDWENFYDRLGGGGFLQALKRNMSELYDYVLIDSRTGLSDTAGICTVQLPSVLVNCFSLSTQAIDGAASVAASVERQRQDSEIRIFPVPMRVEDGEQDKLNASRDYARDCLGVFLSHLADPERYWGEVEVPYKSFYAYEEILATVGDRPRQENTVLAATERIVAYLTDGQVTSLAAPPAEPERRALLARFQRGKADAPFADAGARFGAASPRVFISYEYDSAEHFEATRQLWDLLRRGGVDARMDSPPGQRKADWAERLTSELRAADLVMVVVSPAYKREADLWTSTAKKDGYASAAWLVTEEYFRGPPGRRFLSVVLPGSSADDIPAFLGENAGPQIVIGALGMRGIEPIIDQVAQYARERAAAELSIARRDRLMVEQASGPRRQVATRSRDNLGWRNLSQVADELAVAVGTQWNAEARMRRLNDPYPLPVSWAAADASLTDTWDSLVKLAARGAGWPPLPRARTWAAGPEDLAGEGGELADVLARVPTGRLVVLGEPGTGKTMLMVRLVLDLLARRAEGSPVPFLASVASWNPAGQDLRDWLAAQLLIDHPALAGPPPTGREEPTQAAALLASGLILPVLDGLDEIPERARGSAISQINDALRPGEQLVVTCRTRQYRDVIRPWGGVEVALRAAATVQLRPLDANAVRGYLCDDAAGLVTRARWDPVLAVLGTEAPAGQALSTPLMVGLARAIYNPRPGELTGALRDPAELCSPALADRSAVESLLFDAFIPAAYRNDPSGRWKAKDAESWLVFLARHLERTIGSADLAWWRLVSAIPRNRLRLITGFGGGLVGCFTGALAGWIAAGVAGVVAGGLAGGLVLGLLFGLSLGAGTYRSPVRGTRWKLARGVPAGLLTGLAAGLGIGLAAGIWAGFVAGLTGGLLFGTAIGLTAVPGDFAAAISPLSVLIRDRRTALVSGTIFGLSGLAAGIGAVLAARLTGGLLFGAISGFVFGASAGLALSGSAWPSYMFTRGWLAFHHHLPWPLMSFLSDAHQRGVLRQAGAVYQFRHIELQHRLANRDADERQANSSAPGGGLGP